VNPRPTKLRAAAVLAVAFLTACAPIPVNYAPSSVKSAEGALTVAEFRYLPAEPSVHEDPIPANRILNTAMGEILIDRDVKVFVRDAVFAELRIVGMKMSNKAKVLSGDIEEFLIDDLGYSIDWNLRIKYIVVDTYRNRPIYESVKTTKRHTAKFANDFGALNETIKLNVEALIDDPEFIRAVN
jgi:hypothetical protein